MERQEPVIDSARTLQNRVKLTWREVRDLAAEEIVHEEPSLDAPAESSPTAPAPQPAAAQKSEPQTVAAAKQLQLSEADRAAIAAYLSPRLEETLRGAFRDALDMALANAATRVRSDIERSISGLVSQTVLQELEKIDLEKVLKR